MAVAEAEHPDHLDLSGMHWLLETPVIGEALPLIQQDSGVLSQTFGKERMVAVLPQ